jgi:phosphoribosylglycinamide formyltransferase-1
VERVKLGFYISRRATRFNKILDISTYEMLDSIKVVFSDDVETDYLKDKLLKLNIPYVLYNFKDIPEDEKDKNLVLSNYLLEVLNKYKIDYCFSFGAHILKGDLLVQYKNKIINFHPSLLPHYPGRKAIDQAIQANSFILGNTAHFIDEGVDTGPIIMQSVQHVNIFLDNGYDAILDVQLEMYKHLYTLLKSNRIKVSHNKVYIEGADYGSYSIFPNVR